jgi:hypothetical protein
MDFDPDSLATLVTILRAAGVTRYVCPAFTIEFAAPAPAAPSQPPPFRALPATLNEVPAQHPGYSELFAGSPPRLGVSK